MKKVFNALADVMKDKDLTYLDKCVFCSLLTFNGKGKIFPAIKEIGKRINCNSTNNVSVSLNKLKQNGHIQIIRRFQKSNIYKIGNQSEMKLTKKEIPEGIKEDPNDKVTYMNNAMINVVAEQVASVNGRVFPESADYSFVNSMLKLKESDKYKSDNINTVRKCIMLLYLIKIHADKFKDEIPYPYMKKVYSTAIYKNIRNKIFQSGIKDQTVSFKTGLHNSYN